MKSILIQKTNQIFQREAYLNFIDKQKSDKNFNHIFSFCYGHNFQLIHMKFLQHTAFYLIITHLKFY